MEIASSSHTAAQGDLSRIFSNYQQQIEISTKKSGKTVDEQSNKDTVALSQEGQDLARSSSSSAKRNSNSVDTNDTVGLNKEEVRQLQELKQRDIEVRSHEQAHLAAAGQYVRGGASFTYQKGPDGASYAVGGEVGIDIGKENTPEATITKMQVIRRAALAPASPSGADRSIASAAGKMESQARQEVLRQSQEELLHADTKKKPTIELDEPDVKQKSGDTSPAPTYSTLRTAISTYQRAASY
ncbi:MAG: hypothetical protein KJ630_21885 [Proteobacteria bacterium]|nr:hypothetical protein [Pseudomonadota bacterium]